MNLKNIRIVIIAICAFLAIGFLSTLFFNAEEQERAIVKSSGKALIGGPFELTDHKGNSVTQNTYTGKFKLVLFGFTHCPNICPAELQVVSSALDQIGKKSAEVKTLFITIDPSRDTQENLAAYMGHFHETISGLYGSEEQIAKAAKAYRVYYKKIENKDHPDDYTMDHSAIIYLMDREGNYVKHFTYGTPPEVISAALKSLI